MSPKLTDKEIRLFNALHDSQVEDAKTFSKPKYAMYWASIVDKYKEKAHFVYELLQNADDAKATEVTFQLSEDRLVFRHNGSIGFSVTADEDKKERGHINAITGIGWSTKDKDVEKIGKFGVGFKAVFQYTKEPRVYDDKFWFKIENYIVPTWIENDFPDRKEGETVFVFPFINPREAYRDISHRLRTLENPILFLPHLQKISINIPNEREIVYSKEIELSRWVGGVKHELMTVSNNYENTTIHMFTEGIDIRYKGQNSVQNISVGYLLDKDGNLEVRGKFKVYCFFPTEEDFGLKCIVHAPFLLVDSRQSIKEDAVNTMLKSKLADLATNALPILRDYGIEHGRFLINENIFQMVPPAKHTYGSFGSVIDDPFRNAYIYKIQYENLLLSREKKYIYCKEAMFCRPMSLMGIINDEQLSMLYEGYDEDEEEADGNETYEIHFLTESIQRIYNQDYVSDLKEELEIGDFTGSILANLITPSFMEKQGFAWAKRLYAHLRNEEVGLYKRTNNKSTIDKTPFCLSPIILTSEKKWVAPYQENGVRNVYLPLASKGEGYTFVSQEYEEDRDLKSFLTDLDLKAPDAWDYIQSVVLTGYDKTSISKDKLKNDFDIVYDYVSKLRGVERTSKVKTISERIRLYCSKNTTSIPSSCYDNIDWLKSYFGNTVCFVNYGFYKVFIEKHSLHDFQEFIRELGVKTGPTIEETRSYWLSYAAQKKFSIDNYSTAYITDYLLKGFKEWVNVDINTSKALWTWLRENYTVMMGHREAICKYQYYKWYTKTAEASYLTELKSKAWIFDAKGMPRKISDIHTEDLEANGYLYDIRLVNFFGIERGTKSLKELGATESQIEQNKLGQLAQSLGFDTPDKLEEALKTYQEKIQREQEQARNLAMHRQDSYQNQTDDKQPNDGDDEVSFHGKQRKTDLNALSANSDKSIPTHSERKKPLNEQVNDINQKLADEIKKRIEEEQKRTSVQDMTKYTKKWFSTLLDLEYNSSIAELDSSRSAVKITFNRFRKESGSERVYILSNPSRNIPIWIEEVSGLTVKFTFFNRDDLSLTFDVANVKDFYLRVKAKATDVEALDSIDWEKCAKAVVEVNSPGQIVGRLKNAFQVLPFEDDYNFKEHLTNRISFVFGPPGTGKTTRLADIIKKRMYMRRCKILVLAPTNKACDVLTKKILEDGEYCSWLGRFVATGEEDIENCGILIDRSSELVNDDKCCIVSTIARLPYDGFTDIAGGKLLKDIDWDCVIVDEASMIPLVQMVFAIYKLSASNFIIAGDPMQIPPIVRESGWAGENIFTMVKLDNFEKATTEPIQFEVEKLTRQYRSIPSIGNLYSYYCYEGKLIHARLDSDMRKLPMGKIHTQPVTFVPFRVERYDSIFGAKKLQGSNVHIYSALFAVEFSAYIARQQKENVRIGIICPYAPQAQLINKLMEQRTDIPANVEMSVGTIHGFQGDQCDIILAVFNPPKGIGMAADRIMLNNKSVLNVAISRASDYLFVLLPHPDSYGYSNLIEINKLAGIVKRHVKFNAVINADVIEQYIFGNRSYIESNTFVTNHQAANVYTKAVCRYEVRIDDNAVDIQVGEDNLKTDVTQTVTIQNENSVTKSLATDRINIDKSLEAKGNNNDIHKDIGTKETLSQDSADRDLLTKTKATKIRSSKNFRSLVEYKELFRDNGIDLDEALDILIKDDTICSIYVLFLVCGSKHFREDFNWRNIQLTDISSRKAAIEKTQYKVLYTWLVSAVTMKKFPIKGLSNKEIDSVTLGMFKDTFAKRVQLLEDKRRRKKERKDISYYNSRRNVNKSSSSPNYMYSNHRKEDEKDEKLYDRFEYGLSDWD